MNSDLDDWLNSLGIESTPPTPEITSIVPTQSAAVTQQPQEEQPTSNISPDDLNEILADNGFQEPVYEEAEEVAEGDEGEEEYNENTGEGRDLDAEENEDWNNLNRQQEAGDITLNVRPPIQTEAINAFQVSIGDESVAVPIVHEPVSEDALEVFNAAEESQLVSASEPPIPYNSPTLLLNNATSRFSGTEWYGSIQKAKIILAGLGGIGRIQK